jgi:hypothetical protein
MRSSPAYHLRTNKAVERLLFVELLRRIEKGLPKRIEKYIYVGLGGPYLEEFNLIHSTFGNHKMISLELNKFVLTRQLMNQPHSCVTLTSQSTRQFTDNLKLVGTPHIVWFDFEWPAWDEQIVECCDLLQKLPPMSILKVTLPASTQWLGGGKTSVEKAERLSKMFADYGPFTGGDLGKGVVPATLYSIYRRAIAAAVPDTKRRSVRSIASYSYSDGTPILTATLIVGPNERIAAAIEHIKGWAFSDINWRGPRKIDVPALSIREKLAVDRLLPDAHARTIINKLGLRFANEYHESIEKMSNYVDVYPHVPQFLRVPI